MRAAIRVVMTLVVVGLIVFLVLGYWAGSTWGGRERPSEGAVGSSGTIDTATARERGAELGEKAANAAADMKQTLTEASLTGKIKAKMALDDAVKARTIDVTTSGSTVTLTGKVNSPAERERAVSLARETDGITAVVDRLEIRR
jgi:hyperosmotically inducible protein